MSEDIVTLAKDLLQKDQAAWSDIYTKAREDLRFMSDEQYAQWDQAEVKNRLDTGRQIITLDQLGQFVHQVANDIRMNTPSIKVLPDGEEADVETAEVLQGKIRDIEHYSNADDAYDTAALNAVKARIGFIRIDHEYVNDEGFEQRLCIKRVVNPLGCWIDSDSVECDGRDAMHGFAIDKMKVSKFKELYPKKNPVSFDTGKQSGKELKDDDDIVICEFFRKVEQKKSVAQLENGDIAEFTDGMEFKSKREVTKTTIERYKLSGDAGDDGVLEKTKFPGKYIPIVPVYGEEAWEDGVRKVHSLISKSKDGQRLYNYWRSTEADLLMKAPKAPVMAPAGSVENYKSDWQNPDKVSVLRYEQTNDDGVPFNKPERLEPPTIPTGIVNAAREMVDDIKASMGMYNASLGQRSNETSGVAIDRRKIEGEVATYHFGDNLVRSITQVGRILVSAIPEIYDTPRIERTINIEDEPKIVGINGMAVEGQKRPFDLTRGQYGVRVVTGSSFATKRQEAAQFFTDMITRSPELMNVAGDLLFKNMDFVGAPALAERMKKMIDPKLLESEDGTEQNQQVMNLQAQNQELQQVMQQMQAELQKKDDTFQQQKELAKAQIENKQVNAVLDIERKMSALEKQESDLKLLQQQLKSFEEKIAMQLADNEHPEEPQIEQRNFVDPESMTEEDIAMYSRRRQGKVDKELNESMRLERARQEDMQIKQQSLELQMQSMQQNTQLAAGVIEAISQLTSVINEPKRVIRDDQGRVAGVR